MLLHFIFVIQKEEIDQHSRQQEFEYICKMSEFFKYWIKRHFGENYDVKCDMMPVTTTFFRRINLNAVLKDHRARGEDIYHFYLCYFRPMWTDCTCEGYHAENFGMIWWEQNKSATNQSNSGTSSGNENNIVFYAEKNCSKVSHEIAHEMLRRRGDKNYIETVHDVWVRHFYDNLEFENYDKNFEPTNYRSSIFFSTIDASQLLATS